ncbi:MAG: histidine phosphatase family protein, partial [Emcibacteraceae bacterium]|nr:histidine phosphatase family protein [Emcibacteraceae bacterium]
KNIMNKFVGLVFVTFIALTGVAHADGTYYVVRHAEKQDGDNPILTHKGIKRAAHIAGMLAGEQIAQVYSTETYRTVMTATPTAANKGLEVILFDTTDLSAFADTLKAKSGTYLIVAHSSSTPDLASLLSGTSLPKLAETDYEQIFKVVIEGDKATLTQSTTTFE